MLSKIKKNFEIRKIILSVKKSLSSKFFFCKIKKTETIEPRYIVIISKKVHKNAVVRNGFRRRIFEIIRTNTDKFKNNHAYVFIAKSQILNKNYNEIEKDFLELLNKAGNEK